MLNKNQRLAAKIKWLLRLKGGDYKMREFLKSLLPGILKGEVPLKTAEAIHKTAHRVFSDKHADCRMEELGIRDQELADSMKAMEKVTD
jgi:HEPN domain-containing protein